MLQNIRENAQGTIAKTIIVLLILSLSVWGLDSIVGGSGENSVATINGEPVTEREFQRAVQIQRQRRLQQMETPDAARLDMDQLNEDVMESLIQEKLITQDVRQRGLDLSDQDVDRMITGMEQFQVDGRFSQERFTRSVRNRGLSVEGFRGMLEENHLNRVLQTVVQRSAFSPEAEARRVARVLMQKRGFDVLRVPLDSVRDEVTVTDKEIRDFYDSNLELFRQPEQADVAWITLERKNLVDLSSIEEEQVRQRYQERISNMDVGEKRNPAHILIGADTEQADQRIEKIREALDEGRDFAELAREYSDDSSSADNGGELGMSSPGDFADAFSEALFAIEEEGGIAGPVETQFGTHFIRLLAVEEQKPPSFRELEPQLRQELARERARERYVELSEELADVAYSEYDLDTPSELIDAEIQIRDGVKPDSGEPPFDHPGLRRQLFSEDVAEDDFNTELIEIADGTAVVARVREYSPGKELELASVRDEIRLRLRDRKARAKLDEKLSGYAANLTGGGEAEQVAAELGREWQRYEDVARNSLEAPAIIREAAFRMPKPDEDVLSTQVVRLPDAMGLVWLREISDPDSATTDLMASNLEARLAGRHGQSTFYYYLQQLRSAAKVERD